ncbi:uncharacterized protein LOC108623535 [Ceratina calcarata]|uniref:Uncharacterized protein LOC108623535 n=1 Tax=Ceratina calcarata TaxID=156304 RepID=A0AAJ7IUX6_9HYME|nr:uncharacterized protein LOC108623535 [Ceratina calcarata]
MRTSRDYPMRTAERRGVENSQAVTKSQEETGIRFLNKAVWSDASRREFTLRNTETLLWFLLFSSFKMTIKSILNFGGYKDSYHSPVERYHSGYGNYGGYHHSGSGGYHHSSRGSYKGKGGNGAALSALTLLAFLFLLNVMQQSMDDQNQMTTTTMMTFVLRDGDLPVVVDSKEEKDAKKRDEAKHEGGGQGLISKSKIQRLNSQYIK